MTQQIDPAVRVFEGWETVSVTALPAGWFNTYRREDDEPGVTYVPCPVILVQEYRSTTRCADVLDHHGRRIDTKIETEYCDQPYETRTVAADFSSGVLRVAEDQGDYVSTVYRPDLLQAVE